MKTGPVILSVFGLALLAFLIYSPVTPPAEETTMEETATTSPRQATEEDPDAQVDEALRMLQTGEVPPMQAIMRIREVAEKHPENVKANFTLGMLSIQTGQYDKAVSRFETVTTQQPENADAWKLLAQSQLKTGDTASARVSFEKALSLVDDKTGTAFKKELPELSIN